MQPIICAARGMAPALLSLVALLALCACEPAPSAGPPAQLQTAQAPVVYGEDDRLDYYAHPNAELRRLTREAIVAHMSPGNLDSANPNNIQLRSQTYGPSYGLCQGEPFYEQPSAAGCSGTLIDDDLVLTAGHCVTAQQCPQVRYVFDYYYRAQGELETIQTQDVYSCAQVLARAQQGEDDYAVVKLDRPVVGRAPAPVRRSRERLGQAQGVWIIGFGNGLPAKLDEGGRVNDPGRADGASQFFATVDAFGGNSGSGVFDEGGQVVGILVAGREDYATSPQGCRVVNRVADDLNGENVVYAHRALDALCATGYPSARLCPENVGGWCSACDALEDCQEGWACRPPSEGFAQGRCAPLCARDAECRADHRCEQGFCAPRITQVCRDNTPARQDACLEADLGEPCPEDQACVDGACQPRPEGDNCAAPLVIEPVTQTLSGDLRQGFAADEQGTCAGAGVELVYQFDVARGGRLVAQAEGFDAVLYLRADRCQAGAEVGCNDDIQQGDLRARLDEALTPGRYFLFMDSYDSSTGAYNLALTFTFDDLCQDACPQEGSARCGALGREVCQASAEGCLAWTQDPCAPGLGCVGAGACEACDCDDAGATRCADSAQIEVCAELTGGCSAWTPARVCGDGEVCEAGACVFTCQDACPQEGALACEGAAARRCERGAEGCLAWVTLDTCGPREVCEAGACQPACQDQCASLNARRCGDGGAVETCRVGQGGCLAWVEAQSCAPGEVCAGQGTCQPACQDACASEGASRCEGEGVQTCARGRDGCLAWGAVQACAPDEACLSGLCSPACGDACELGERVCGEDGQVLRCDPGPFGCPEQVVVEACARGQRCEQGACVGACQDACARQGQTRCTAQEAVEVCDTDDGGCLAWFVAVQCADDERCEDGLCLPREVPDAGTDTSEDVSEDVSEDASQDASEDVPEDADEDSADEDLADEDAPSEVGGDGLEASVESQRRVVQTGGGCEVAPARGAGAPWALWGLLAGAALLARRVLIPSPRR